MGVRGGIEYGFSSTTTDREQAMVYAGGSDARDSDGASTIFEMQMGMVDRGADLTWLSQYPHEREVLLPPLTGIEALGTDVEGSLMIIHSRLSLNLAALTLEQVLSRRRKMLLDMKDGIELEMRDSLGEDHVRLGIRLLNKALSYGPLSRDPEWFNDDENFAECMQQTLYLQHGIVSEIKTFASDASLLPLKGWKLGGPSRMLLLAGWAFHKSTLTGSDNALTIDLSGAKLSASEASQLADLLVRRGAAGGSHLPRHSSPTPTPTTNIRTRTHPPPPHTYTLTQLRLLDAISLALSHRQRGCHSTLPPIPKQSANPKLTSVDVRNNESMSMDGAKVCHASDRTSLAPWSPPRFGSDQPRALVPAWCLLASAHTSSPLPPRALKPATTRSSWLVQALSKFMGGLGRGVSHVPRSLCGVTPSSSTLEVPKSLGPIELHILCAEVTRHSLACRFLARVRLQRAAAR